jgi:hypothetical protein
VIFQLVDGLTIAWVDVQSREEDRQLARQMLDFIRDIHSTKRRGTTLSQFAPEDRELYNKLDKRLRMIDERDCSVKAGAVASEGYDLCHVMVDPGKAGVNNKCILQKNHPSSIPHIAPSGYQRLEDDKSPAVVSPNTDDDDPFN